MDRLAEHLDAAHGAVSVQNAASVRQRAARRWSGSPPRDRKGPSDQGLSSCPLWGGVDSNHRPTDYEAAAKRFTHLRKWLKALVEPFTRLLKVRMG